MADLKKKSWNFGSESRERLDLGNITKLWKNRMVLFGPQHAKTSLPAYAESDQGLHCPFTEPLDTIECFNVEQRPG